MVVSFNYLEIKNRNLFKWFKSDIKKKEAFIGFLNNYSNVTISVQADINYRNYSWVLNE